MSTQTAERHQAKVKYAGQNPENIKQDILILEPWFRTNYPFKIYLKDGQLGNIRQGDTVTVQKGKQTTNKKTGVLNDPKFESSFYWDLVEPDLFNQPQSQAASPAAPSAAHPSAASSPATTTQAAPTATPAPEPKSEAPFRTPAQNMRTDALKYALDWHKDKGTKEADIVASAAIFEKYLANGSAVPVEGGPL